MKHLILWGLLLVFVVVAGFVWDKASVSTKFIEEPAHCPVYANIIFCFFGAYMLVTRGYALIIQIFKP